MTRKEVGTLLLVALCAIVALASSVPMSAICERHPSGHRTASSHRRRHRDHHRRTTSRSDRSRVAWRAVVDDAGRVGAGRQPWRWRLLALGACLGAARPARRGRGCSRSSSRCAACSSTAALPAISPGSTKGFGTGQSFEWLRALASGSVGGVPMPFVLMCVVAALAWVTHRSVRTTPLRDRPRVERRARVSTRALRPARPSRAGGTRPSSRSHELDLPGLAWPLRAY